MQEYFDACTKLSLQLLEAFCIGLDLPAKFMHADFASNHTGFLRLNYYPVHDPIEGAADDYQQVADLGVHHHTDAGALTVLIQDEVGGLQVHREGYWYDIPPVPGAIVINTGDMMQVWSNDVYHAPVHRVLAMDDCDRYSLPFFFNPAADARVSPLPTVINEHNPSRYQRHRMGQLSRQAHRWRLCRLRHRSTDIAVSLVGGRSCRLLAGSINESLPAAGRAQIPLYHA